VLNQRGETVQEGDTEIMVERRPARTAARAGA